MAVAAAREGGLRTTEELESICVIRGQNLLKEGLSADDADGRRWNYTGMTVGKRQSVVFITEW